MNRVSQYLTSNQEELIVRGSNVASLLKRYIEGKISADQLSKWGKFVFHGYPTWNQYQGGRLPLPISYESSVEDLLSEVVSELEEIGDLIDGEFLPDRALFYVGRLDDSRRDRAK